MNYKKDMLLILTVVLILGATIQTARTDLISTLSTEGGLPGKIKEYYVANSKRQVVIIRDIKARHTIFNELFNSLKVE